MWLGQCHISLGPRMICVNCEKSTCSVHKTRWHHGIPCKEYDTMIKMVDSKTKSYIVRFTKPCPQCKARIEKNEGCDHMACRCKTEFCWECLSIFNGQRQHRTTCSYFNTSDAWTAETIATYRNNFYIDHDRSRRTTRNDSSVCIIL